MLSRDQPVPSVQVPVQLPPVAALTAPITLLPGQVWPGSVAPTGATGLVGSWIWTFGIIWNPGDSARTEMVAASAAAGAATVASPIASRAAKNPPERLRSGSGT